MTSVRKYRDGTADARTIVIFPHAGGSANFYRSWADTDEDVTILATQYPGRADRLREPCHRQLTDLADELAADLACLPDRPTIFLGHSMGATVAFEVARRREAAGHSPVLLVASAARAPRRQVSRTELGTAWDDDQAVEWLKSMRQVGPELVENREILQIILGYVRADYEMLQSHTYAGAPLDGDILAVTGNEDLDVTEKHAVLWQEFSTGRFRHVSQPGGHFYLDPTPPIALFLDPFGTPVGRCPDQCQ